MRMHLLAGALALVLPSFVIGSTTTAADSAAVQAARKPRPTPSATVTPTVAPAGSPTATPTAEPESAPTPSSSSTSSVCLGQVTYLDQVWCTGTIAGIDSGRYGTGTRVVLAGLIVESVDGSTVVVMGFWCPEGYYCGAMMEATTIDFSGLPDVPTVGTWIDVYGMTGAPGVFEPVAFVVG